MIPARSSRNGLYGASVQQHDMPREAMLTLPALQKNLQLHFEKYEIKTLRISDEG